MNQNYSYYNYYYYYFFFFDGVITHRVVDDMWDTRVTSQKWESLCYFPMGRKKLRSRYETSKEGLRGLTLSSVKGKCVS